MPAKRPVEEHAQEPVRRRSAAAVPREAASQAADE